jgi:hypothetical protein
MENLTTINKLAGQVRPSRRFEGVTTFRELTIVAILLGITNLFANYLLSPFFGLYEDDYELFLNSQIWNSHQLLGYIKDWCLGQAAQGRPIGFALNGIVGYLTRGHSLESAYLIGWLIMTINAVLLYLILSRASNRFAAVVGSVTYLLIPVDLSKMILMHRVFLHGSVLLLLVSLLLYTTGKIRWKAAGFICAASLLVIYEGFYLPFIVAPLLEPGPAKKKFRNFLLHLVLFCIPLGVILSVRYFTGEQRINVMATGGTEMLKRMAESMWVGPTTGISMFVLRPIETLLAADAFPKLVGFLCFSLIAAYLLGYSRIRPLNDQETWRGKAIFLGIAAVIAMVFPYILMYRESYYPPNMTVGRFTGAHAPAALGYASLAAVCAYICWFSMRRIRAVVVLIFAFYLSVLVAFGVHVQAAEYVEGWNNQQFVWRRVISQCPDVQEGMPILVDLEGLPASIAFPNYWPLCAWEGNTLSLFVQFPAAWKKPPRIDAYEADYEHEIRNGELLMKAPAWSSQWPTISDGNFIFFHFVDGDLRRISEPVMLFGKEFVPKKFEPAPALKLTRLGTTILGAKTSADWIWLHKASPYGQQ